MKESNHKVVSQELWDLYDCDRRPLGRVCPRGTQLPEGSYHIVVHLCIFNDAGEMLIQQRAYDKDTFHGLWDLSVGGSALAGEDSQAAIMRECREELGFTPALHAARPYLTVHFQEGFDDVYVAVCKESELSLHLQEEEVASVTWAEEETVLSMIDEGTFIPYHPSYISLLFRYRHYRGNFSLSPVVPPSV